MPIITEKNTQNTLLYTIEQLLKRHIDNNFTLTALKGDAGHRNYFRVTTNNESLILMHDNNKESLTSYKNISNIFIENNVICPETIITEKTLLLQTDFGDTHVADKLKSDNIETYKKCIKTLINMQKIDITKYNLCYYDVNKLQQESELSIPWVFRQHTQKPLTTIEQKEFKIANEKLCKIITKIPQTIVHRDFHCRNLMLTKSNEIGIIDFQDAIIGPFCYDIGSLLRDYYFEINNENLNMLIAYYYEKAKEQNIFTCSQEQFTTWFYQCSLQRHLKVLGIFSRLHYRDGKSKFLQHLTTVIKYIYCCIDNLDEFHNIRDIIEKRV